MRLKYLGQYEMLSPSERAGPDDPRHRLSFDLDLIGKGDLSIAFNVEVWREMLLGVTVKIRERVFKVAQHFLNPFFIREIARDSMDGRAFSKRRGVGV